jgi:hypothetical protein
MKVLFVVNAIHRWERLGILTLSAILKRAEHEAYCLCQEGIASPKLSAERVIS